MSAEGSGTIRRRIKNLLRSPSIKLRRSSAARHKNDLSGKLPDNLERKPEEQTSRDPGWTNYVSCCVLLNII
ncbi:hypothetical protein AMECASPLE_029325 [Ameca splendens]|uniref:Uncharacterized protein n=1 Tax=Ameca splendens TaxID=208324 RepID=A0ABV1A1X2_9TELE